jgi:riboflavin biosynthesis pyrimidine reductase
MSLDGCLTKHHREGNGFASEDDRRFFGAELNRCDCTVMGGAAYRAARGVIRANLEAARLRVVLTRTPSRYDADSRPGRLEFTASEPAQAVGDLARRGFSRCAVVGGSRTLTDCLRHGILDQLWVTVEPVVFGQGARLVDGAVDFGFELLTVERLGAEAVLLKYRARRTG